MDLSKGGPEWPRVRAWEVMHVPPNVPNCTLREVSRLLELYNLLESLTECRGKTYQQLVVREEGSSVL